LRTFVFMKESYDNLIFGRHPVLEALQGGTSLDKVLIQQGVRGEFEKEVRQLCRDRQVPLQPVPKERLQSLIKGNHQGIAAWVAPLTYHRLENVIPHLYEMGENPLILVLDRVSDTRNLGAIARSAEVCGVHALVVPKKGSAQVTPEAIKTSAGALTKLTVCREPNTLAAIETLQAAGVAVFVSAIPSEKALYELDLKGPIALVVGAESKGVSREVMQAADTCFWIPQKGTTDSFNVSVAAGIMLYETIRQRGI
jgi:23S rRNA (guanosine2251-2'-O)-methyltransferase